MSSKNISLREDVYLALRDAKGPDESFSDVIERLLNTREGRHPLFELVGLLDEDEIRELRDGSKNFRERVDSRMESES